eukprot:6224045-Pyramimonas_sp.AAC.1
MHGGQRALGMVNAAMALALALALLQRFEQVANSFVDISDALLALQLLTPLMLVVVHLLWVEFTSPETAGTPLAH